MSEPYRVADYIADFVAALALIGAMLPARPAGADAWDDCQDSIRSGRVHDCAPAALEAAAALSARRGDPDVAGRELRWLFAEVGEVLPPDAVGPLLDAWEAANPGPRAAFVTVWARAESLLRRGDLAAARARVAADYAAIPIELLAPDAKIPEVGEWTSWAGQGEGVSGLAILKRRAAERPAAELPVHADPRTTMRYDRARKNLDRHPNYILAAFMASGT